MAKQPGYDKAKKQIEAREAELELQYETWRSHYREIKEYIAPNLGENLDKKGSYESNDGKKLHGSMYDSTPENASEILASGMQSGLTSPARPWFRLGPENQDLVKNNEVKEYLSIVQDRMYLVLSKSNFYDSTHSSYLELSTFGTCAIVANEHFRDIVNYRVFTTGEFKLIMNEYNEVVGIYREYNTTAGQLVSQFGEDAVSKSTKEKYKNGCLETRIRCRHIIEPNDSRFELKDIMKRPFRSIYYELDGNEYNFLEVKGYEENPLAAARWKVKGNDTYGRSPGMQALPDVKSLHTLNKYVLMAAQKQVNPPVKAPAGLHQSMINLIPGGITYYPQGVQGGAPPSLEPLYMVNFDMNAGEAKAEALRMSIRRGFYNDLFLMLASLPTKNMTATEVIQRHEEKLLMLGPVLNRLHHELLSPLIRRTYAIMDRVGALPPPPEILQGQNLKIEYISILAQAQKMVEITGIEQLAGYVGNLVAVYPEARDKFNVDKSIDKVALAIGTDPELVRTDEEVAEIRQMRADAEQAQQNAQAAMLAADGAKTLSETNMNENSALNALLNRPTGG